MNNLTVCRGRRAEERMIGPGDYYTNLEKPGEKAFIVSINNGIPVFTEHKISKSHPPSGLRPILDHELTEVDVRWFSREDKKISWR